MKTFLLKIGTPDGLWFEGEVERVVCRSITGDMTILANHCNFCTALGRGNAYIILPDGSKRMADCAGGMVSMMDGQAHLLTSAWEWLK